MSSASTPSPSGYPSTTGAAVTAPATAKKPVRMLDEKTFSKKIFDEISSATTIKLLLVPRTVLQPSADNCLTFDIGMAMLEKFTIDVPSADASLPPMKTQLINIFSSAEQYYVGNEFSCFIRAVVPSAFVSNKWFMEQLIDLLKSEFILSRIGVPADATYFWRVPPESAEMMQVVNVVDQLSVDQLNGMSVVVEPEIGKFGWKRDWEHPKILVGISGAGSERIIQILERKKKFGPLTYSSLSQEVPTVKMSLLGGAQVGLERMANLSATMQVRVGGVDASEIEHDGGRFATAFAARLASVHPLLRAAKLAETRGGGW